MDKYKKWLGTCTLLLSLVWCLPSKILYKYKTSINNEASLLCDETIQQWNRPPAIPVRRFRIRYLYMSDWQGCISMWCSRCLWRRPTVNLVQALLTPRPWSPPRGLRQPLKDTGVKLVSDRLREMKTCVMLLAALMLPSIQAGKNIFFSFFFLYSLFQGYKDIWCLEIQTINTRSLKTQFNTILSWLMRAYGWNGKESFFWKLFLFYWFCNKVEKCTRIWNRKPRNLFVFCFFLHM